MIPIDLDVDRMEKRIEERIQHYEQKGLSLQESIPHVVEEIEEDSEWAPGPMGRAYTFIANYQFKKQILGGREKHQRGPDFPKVDRNGYKKRKKRTSKGIVVYYDPQPRKGHFRSAVTKPYKKYTKSCIDILSSLRKAGMSIKKISELSNDILRSKISRSTVSRLLMGHLKEENRGFNEEPIRNPHEIRTVKVDAYYKPVRGFGKVAVYVIKASRKNTSGIKTDEVLSSLVNPPETAETWYEALQNVYDRGLRMGPDTLFIADGHKGIRKALSQVYPEAGFQGCQFHKMVNLYQAFRKDRPRKKGVKWEPIRSRIYQDIFHVLDKKEALHGLIRFSDDYQSKLPKLVEGLWASFDDVTTYLDYDLADAVQNRTTGSLERNHREARRYTNGVSCYPTLDSFQRVIDSVYKNFNLEQAKKLSGMDNHSVSAWGLGEFAIPAMYPLSSH
ncbi:IS256 family transposase [Pasteuria penetrans]|uniref:IS256 family transposase n=1 Tax=Pasteuria penetrans TaxID=86005 RepID=UPI000F940B9A|nr:transposase [Pasteuria penetrans]